MGGGGGSPSPPPPSREERRLYAVQAELVREQIRLGREQEKFFNEFLPLQREHLELEADYRRNVITNLNKLTPSDEVLNLQEQVALAQGERALQAARGELPVSSGILRGFDRQESQLADSFRDRFGLGFETSSPYLQALSDFQANREVAIDQASRGDLSIASQLFSQSLGQNLSALSQSGPVSNLANTVSSGYQGISSIFGQAGNTAAGLSGQLFQNRNLAFQGQLAAYQSRQQGQAALFGGLGALGGAVLGGPIGSGIASSIFGRANVF